MLEVAGPVAADLRGDGGGPVDRARYRAALRCRTGHARVAVGGRGAVLAPLRDVGLVLVDDEASPAYKERREPRHHARDVALARARMGGAVAVLTGDLPSAALWRLLTHGHVTSLAPARPDRRARAPRVDVVDLDAPRPGTRRARLSQTAARALSAAVRAGGAAVVLASRRGDGTALACRTCGRRRACPVCDSALAPDATPAAAAPPPPRPAPPRPPPPAWVATPRGGGARPARGRGRRPRAPPAAAPGRRRWRRGRAATPSSWRGRTPPPRSCAWRASTPRAPPAARRWRS